MTTFWTGSALAADYGQNRIQALRVATRLGRQLDHEEQSARQEAFTSLNKAIRAAVLSQFDEQESALHVDDGDDGAMMHGGCLECFPYAAPVPVAVFQSGCR